MAILGAQLVLSMVMASFLSKISPQMSFARWILCSRLVRYLHPTDEELKSLGNVPSGPPKGKAARRNYDQKKKEPFTVPKNIDIQLESAQIKAIDVLPLHFYGDYQWLIDFSFCGILIYVLTELYYAVLNPKAEFNLSMMWCMLVIAFCVKVMFSLTAIYFRTEEGSERIICVLFGFFFLILSMGILIVNEDTLEFGLQAGYIEFTEGARELFEKQGMGSTGPMSLLTYRIILAFLSAILGAFLTFPGLRIAKMYNDATKYAGGSPFTSIFLNMNIVFPMLISLLWFKPVVRDYIVKKNQHGKQLVTEEAFEAFRLIMIWIFCLFRFSLVWTHLQAHLNLAYTKIELLKKEAGRISSVEIQKMVAHVFYYLCVVALQYVTPIIFLLYLSFMLKTLGDYSIADAFGGHLGAEPNETFHDSIQKNFTDSIEPNREESIASTAAEFTLALANLRQIFTAAYFKGLFSYLCWWTCTTWFITSAFGILYCSYFSDNQ